MPQYAVYALMYLTRSSWREHGSAEVTRVKGASMLMQRIMEFVEFVVSRSID